MYTSTDAVVLSGSGAAPINNVNDKSPQGADDCKGWVQRCGSAELYIGLLVSKARSTVRRMSKVELKR